MALVTGRGWLDYLKRHGIIGDNPRVYQVDIRARYDGAVEITVYHWASVDMLDDDNPPLIGDNVTVKIVEEEVKA